MLDEPAATGGAEVIWLMRRDRPAGLKVARFCWLPAGRRCEGAKTSDV